MHFTDPWFEVGTLLHCLHNFLVLVGQFSEGYSCDVLLGLYMAVHAHGYSERGKKIWALQLFHGWFRLCIGYTEDERLVPSTHARWLITGITPVIRSDTPESLELIFPGIHEQYRN